MVDSDDNPEKQKNLDLSSAFRGRVMSVIARGMPVFNKHYDVLEVTDEQDGRLVIVSMESGFTSAVRGGTVSGIVDLGPLAAQHGGIRSQNPEDAGLEYFMPHLKPMA